MILLCTHQVLLQILHGVLTFLALGLRRGELDEVGGIDVVFVNARHSAPAHLLAKDALQLAVNASEYWVEVVLFGELNEFSNSGSQSSRRRNEGVSPGKDPSI